MFIYVRRDKKVIYFCGLDLFSLSYSVKTVNHLGVSWFLLFLLIVYILGKKCGLNAVNDS